MGTKKKVKKAEKPKPVRVKNGGELYESEIDPERAEKLLRLRELRIAYLERLKNFRYKYYIPIGKTSEFLDNFGSGRYKTCFYSAANGVGKTTVEISMLAHLIWPCGSKWFQQEIFRNWRYPKVFRLVSDPTTVREVIVPAMERIFPKGRWKAEKKGKNYNYHWESDTGWSGDVMTYDQDVKEFESATVGIVLFDEPPPKAIYKASVSRTRLGGVIAIFATPLMGSAWLYDEFVADPEREAKGRYWITAEVEDACEEHGVRGFLKHENILSMIAQYDEEDKQARIFGKFQHLIGLVFKMFKSEVHIIRPMAIDRGDYYVIQAYDPHPRNEDAVLWVAIDREGTKYVIDELYMNGDKEEIVARIQEKDDRYGVEERLIDPSAFIEDKHSGISWASMLADKYGLEYEAGSKRRTDAVQRIKGALNYVVVNGVMVKPPELYVFDTCKRFIWEVTHWQWQEWSGRGSELKDPKEKPQDANDHLIEDLGRILLMEPRYREPKYSGRVSGGVIVDDPFS